MFLSKWIDRFFEFWNRLGERLLPSTPEEPPGQVVIEPGGVTLRPRESPTIKILWARVLEIFAYKEDRGVVDHICIGFRTSNSGDYYRVGEDWMGYKDLCEELARLPGGINEKWWAQVAFPAFATNRTTIWGEAKPWSEHEADSNGPAVTRG